MAQHCYINFCFKIPLYPIISLWTQRNDTQIHEALLPKSTSFSFFYPGKITKKTFINPTVCKLEYYSSKKVKYRAGRIIGFCNEK